MASETIHEPGRDVPVIARADVCVLGGSCTGVFAAIRAARLGCRVVLVERAGMFGGVATLSMVNVWHSPMDTDYRIPIIGGLTTEIIDRLRKRGAVTDRPNDPNWAWAFNSAQLAIELDEMVREARITPMLHTILAATHIENDRVVAAIVENKSGRGAIVADMFIDATGDGDLCHRAGIETYKAQHMQPSTTCAALTGWASLKGVNLGKLLLEHGGEHDLPQGFAWGAEVPDSDVYMLAGTRVYEADCSEAQGLTHAEMEGRRQVRAILDIVRQHAPQAKLTLQALPARIGIRETRHVRCLHQLTGDEVLTGTRFDDAIANGSYRVDIHHHDKPGITFRYLDGKEVYIVPGRPSVTSRWRPVTEANPTFYQIPYRSMVPRTSLGNVLCAGRMIDADGQAHAAIRVMVNMNQTGEAAGVASTLALRARCSVADVDVTQLRQTLAQGGSIILA